MVNGNKIQFKILTPEGSIYNDEAEQATIPTKDGEITVLPHHAPLVSVVKPGEIRVVKHGHTYPHYVSGGTLEIRNDNTMRILTDHSEKAEEINIEVAESAYERAKEAMENKENVHDVDFARFQAMMEKELARLRVGKKWQ